MIKLVHRDFLSCEAIVRRCFNGDLILISQCGDTTEPAPLNRVYLWRSLDNGETWSKPNLIIPENGRAVYQTEVSVFNEEIRVYLTLHNGKFSDFSHQVIVSYDNGYTFENIGKVPLLDGFVFMRGLHINQKGEHLLPYQHYPLTKEESSLLTREYRYIWESKIANSELGTLISSDNGKTYTRSNDVLVPLWKDGAKRWVWGEPTLASLKDGTVVMLIRVDKEGYLYQSTSKDFGHTWSEMERTNIPNPSNKPKLINLDDGRIALINTPNNGFGMNSRNPLTLWISDDDMQTWEYKKDLVTFPGWISYPDGFVENNILYLAFEFNRHDVYFLKVEI